VRAVHFHPCLSTVDAVDGNDTYYLEIMQIYFGTQHTRVYISAHLLAVTCMTGMSTLLRKDYFEKAVGGLCKLSPYIAEDYFMAKSLSEG